ncbi:predicted protein [Plenodomus lingam JN3]|uniref:Predicted protein n=1 Tax=Leptosphaeria maculans (strain JN3 / isolate v23.1.3 / race Av1-4-5-6-7-8) TaxID=985895 RepID=E5R4D9_LEPMJ|nr:predicted protein [Plenodomus lingam JN3]CBX91907.1 predicted protein [Plenodomus lingam JN3]
MGHPRREAFGKATVAKSSAERTRPFVDEQSDKQYDDLEQRNLVSSWTEVFQTGKRYRIVD